MCKIGDIIVIEKYIGEDGKMIYRHSFVVINDKKGYIDIHLLLLMIKRDI